jgi:phenylalanyl-tRNA synthetase alpha chain
VNEKLQEMMNEFEAGIGSVESLPAMAQFKAEYLGKKGRLKALMSGMRGPFSGRTEQLRGGG